MAAAIFNARKALRRSLGVVGNSGLLDQLAPRQVLAHRIDLSSATTADRLSRRSVFAS